jgi:23S rRNA (uracil1939-C5)-methyltransferase
VPGLSGVSVNPADVIVGTPYLTDAVDVGGSRITLRRHVLAFFQGNRYLLRDLVSYVVSQIEGERVIDLYAGGGLFSVAAAVTCGARVTAVEGDRTAAADLSWNASQAGAGAIEVVHQPVERFVAGRHAPPSVLIVDPPRSGMSPEAVTGVIRMRPRSIVYVSCDVATMARDARRLLDAGYALRTLTAFDLFPNTPHVETVGTFTS